MIIGVHIENFGIGHQRGLGHSAMVKKQHQKDHHAAKKDHLAAQLKCPLKPLRIKFLRNIEHLKWSTMMPRNAGLSAGCTPDPSRNFQ